MADPKTDTHALHRQGPAPSASDKPPQANEVDEAGSLRRVLRIWQTAQLRSGRQVEYVQFGGDGLRPLIWLHSIEYPMAPPWGLCVDAAAAGFGIVAIRRPGFGGTSRVDSIEEEVRLLDEFIEASGYDNAVLIMEGSARPAGLRLALSSKRIAFSILAKPAYNNRPLEEGEPDWVASILRQALLSDAGANLALASFRNLGASWLYGSFFSVEGDQDFVKSHRRDVVDAWRCVRHIDADTFRRNIAFAEPDPLLVPGALAGFPGIAVIGADSPEPWRAGFDARSEELCIRTFILPKGCIFTLQQSRQELLALLADIG